MHRGRTFTTCESQLKIAMGLIPLVLRCGRKKKKVFQSDQQLTSNGTRDHIAGFKFCIYLRFLMVPHFFGHPLTFPLISLTNYWMDCHKIWYIFMFPSEQIHLFMQYHLEVKNVFICSFPSALSVLCVHQLMSIT